MLSTLLILLVVGLAAGVLAGLLGIGGGLVIVPALTALLVSQGYPESDAVPLAVATSLATMLLTSASSIWFHHRRGVVDWATVARLGTGVALGAAIGAWLATVLPGGVLAKVFAVVAGGIGLKMILAVSPGERERAPRARWWGVFGPLIGAVSAVVGIGGGTFNVPYLARNGYRMVEAVAIAAACGWPIALAGAATFALLEPLAAPPASVGHVWLPGMFTVGVAGMAGAPAGVALAHRLPAARLGRAFGFALLVIAVRMAW